MLILGTPRNKIAYYHRSLHNQSLAALGVYMCGPVPRTIPCIVCVYKGRILSDAAKYKYNFAVQQNSQYVILKQNQHNQM